MRMGGERWVRRTRGRLRGWWPRHEETGLAREKKGDARDATHRHDRRTRGVLRRVIRSCGSLACCRVCRRALMTQVPRKKRHVIHLPVTVAGEADPFEVRPVQKVPSRRLNFSIVVARGLFAHVPTDGEADPIEVRPAGTAMDFPWETALGLWNSSKRGCCSAHQQSRTCLALSCSMRMHSTVPDRAPPSVPMRGPARPYGPPRPTRPIAIRGQT